MVISLEDDGTETTLTTLKLLRRQFRAALERRKRISFPGQENGGTASSGSSSDATYKDTVNLGYK